MNFNKLSRRKFISVSAAGGLGYFMNTSFCSAKEIESYQIGCYTRPWDKFEYRIALDGIAKAGYRYAGLMTAKCDSWVLITVDSTDDQVAEIASEAWKRQLKIISIYGGAFPVEKSVRAGIQGLKKLIDHCAICKCGHLLLGGTTNKKLVEDYYKVVGECCGYASEKKVKMSIKPHGGQNATGAQCSKIVSRVNHPGFGIWYDPGNIYYYSDAKLDPVKDVPDVNGKVIGMSVKDFIKPKNVMVTPGKGMVDFKSVMTVLYQGGFKKGPLIVECLEPGDLEHLNKEAMSSRIFLEKLVADLKNEPA